MHIQLERDKLCGNNRLFPAKRFQFLQIRSYLSFLVEFVIVVCSQILEGHTVFEDVVDSDQHGMGNSNIGTLFATVGADLCKLSIKVGAFVPYGGMGAYHQGGSKHGIPLSRLARPPLMGAFVVSRTQPRL